VVDRNQPNYPPAIMNAAYARRFAEFLDVPRLGFVWDLPVYVLNQGSKRNILRVKFVVPAPVSPLACELLLDGPALVRGYHCPFVAVPDPETGRPKPAFRFENRDVEITGDSEAWTFTIDFDVAVLMSYGDPQRLIDQPVVVRIVSSREVARESLVEGFLDV